MSYKKTITNPNYTVYIFVTDDQVVDAQNDWIDVEVALNTGERFYPSFFTIERIQQIMKQDKIEGDNLNGLYFWAADQIIVEQITEDTILKTIEFLYSKSLLASMFCNTVDEN